MKEPCYLSSLFAVVRIHRVALWERTEIHKRFCLENPKERDHLEDLGLDK
jgi:hypothetical protein